MSQRIFISYKRVDKKIVFPIKDYIEKNVGATCWIDLDGIESDAQFVNVIMNAIDNASVFLFMYSQAHSIIKDYSTDWTVRELNYAQKKGKRIVFINIDKYPLSDYFLFMFPQKQQVDATSKEAMQKLCHDLKAWLNIKTPTPTPPPPPPPKPEWLRRIKSFISNTIRNIWHGIKVIVKWISSKVKTIAIVICCAAAIALGWMFIPQIISIFNNEEAKAWRAAKQENTVESYLSFLESQPIRHRDEAISRIIRYGNSESNLVGLLNLQQDSSLLNNSELMDSLARSIIWWDKDVRKKMEHISRWFADDTKDYERLDGIEDTVMIIDSIVGLVQKHTQVIDTLEHKMNWVSRDVPHSIIQSWDTTFAPAMVALANYHTNTLQTLVKKGYEMVESHTAKESYLQRIRILERLCNQSAVGPKEKKSSIYEDGTKAVVEFFYYGFPKSPETLSRTSQ